MKKFLAILMAAVMMLSITCVFAEETDWESFEDWANVDWDAKTVKYQFTGTWDLDEYNIHLTFAINLYEDGSVAVDQRNTASHSSYFEYGYWSEEADEDGNCITLDTILMTNNNPEDPMVAHEYSYELYEEADGAYSFGYTFGISAGAYFRTVDVAGSSEILYPTFAAFEAAVDQPAE